LILACAISRATIKVPFNFNVLIGYCDSFFQDIRHGLTSHQQLALNGASGNNRAGFTSNCSTKFRLYFSFDISVRRARNPNPTGQEAA
jgi:hypothetical protein